MTAEEFKNSLDTEIVEYLNAHTLPVSKKYLDDPTYKCWSLEFWKHVDVIHFKKINMLLMNEFNDPIFKHESESYFVEDYEVEDAWICDLFTDLFFKCCV